MSALNTPTFEYANRKGVKYYLHRHVDRKGSVRYVMKRSKEGALADVPPGYEVVENVNGCVSVRRPRPRQIWIEEEDAVRSGLAKHDLDVYRIEVKGAQITIFEPDRDPEEIAALFDSFDMMPAGIGERVRAMARAQFGDAALNQLLAERRERVRRQFEKTIRYAPVLRFRLVDQQRRLFEVARMSYRGEGGWHALALTPLAAAVKKYVKHLGRDSFFELL